MGYPVEILNPDPQTGLIGITFDESALGENGAIETCVFNFYLPDEAYKLHDINRGNHKGRTS